MLQKLGAFDFEKNYRKLLKTAIVMTVLLKLLLMGLFSSDYQDLMFITFVQCFLCGECRGSFGHGTREFSGFCQEPGF